MLNLDMDFLSLNQNCKNRHSHLGSECPFFMYIKQNGANLPTCPSLNQLQKRFSGISPSDARILKTLSKFLGHHAFAKAHPPDAREHKSFKNE